MKQLYPVMWDSLPKMTVCSSPMYAHFATFLVTIYLIDVGAYKNQKLSLGSVLDYMGILIQLAYRKYKEDKDRNVYDFFTCLNIKADSASARWWQGTKKNIIRSVLERAKEEGEVLDKSVPPVYLEHIAKMRRILSLHGSAAVRCA